MLVITPELATKLIEANDDEVARRGVSKLNRPIRDVLVARYGDDMEEGRWDINGETMAIAKSGRVLNGQHRLWASIRHNVSFPTFLVTGFKLEEEDGVFDSIDAGSPRTSGDHLAVAGISYSSVVSTTARLVMAYENKNLSMKHMATKIEVTNYAKLHAERMVETASFITKNGAFASDATLGAWHYIFSEKNKAMADAFILDLKEGSGLLKGDPVYTLREKLIYNARSKSKYDSRLIFIMGVNCWNDRRANKSRTALKLPESMECPRAR
jgi:hypothetical protein